MIQRSQTRNPDYEGAPRGGGLQQLGRVGSDFGPIGTRICSQTRKSDFNRPLMGERHMTTPLNILVIEDSEYDVAFLVAELERAGFDPRWKRVETEADCSANINANVQSSSWLCKSSETDRGNLFGRGSINI
jgi:hypothetical protein